MLYWLLYFFVAFGSKLLLALVTIYLLLPSEGSCNGCDEETLLLRMGRGRRIVSLVFLGRVQRRWCPRCGWEGYAQARRRTTRGTETASHPLRYREGRNEGAKNYGVEG